MWSKFLCIHCINESLVVINEKCPYWTILCLYFSKHCWLFSQDSSPNIGGGHSVLFLSGKWNSNSQIQCKKWENHSNHINWYVVKMLQMLQILYKLSVARLSKQCATWKASLCKTFWHWQDVFLCLRSFSSCEENNVSVQWIVHIVNHQI